MFDSYSRCERRRLTWLVDIASFSPVRIKNLLTGLYDQHGQALIANMNYVVKRRSNCNLFVWVYRKAMTYSACLRLKRMNR